MKNILYITVASGFVLSAVLFVILTSRHEQQKIDNAPKIQYADTLNITVEKISFERNGLFINNQVYNGFGISWHSTFFDSKSQKTVALQDIQPPYTLKKSINNDTIYILKGKECYHFVIDVSKR